MTRLNAATATAPNRWILPVKARAPSRRTSDICSPSRRPASIATRASPITCRTCATFPAGNKATAARRPPCHHPFPLETLRADPEHRDRTAVLRPARDVVADRDRPLLPVRDRAHALRLDAARNQIVAHRLRAACAQGDVVLASAAFVGVTFDGELAVLAVVGQPLRLLVERRSCLHRELGRVGFKEHAVADIDHEILLAAGRCLACSIGLCVLGIPGAGRYRQCRRENGREASNVQRLPHVDHNPVPPFTRTDRSLREGLAGRSLSERSINLDGTLRRPRKTTRTL